MENKEKSSLITEKIEQLIALAEVEDEVNVRIVLLALSGARTSDMDGMLAAKVQEYLKDVLIPKIRADREAAAASLN